MRQEQPVDTNKKGICQHGNFTGRCLACGDSPDEQSETTSEDAIERRRQIQLRAIREWAERQNPPLREGEDFIFWDPTRLDNDVYIAPHERNNLYLSYDATLFDRMRTFFENDYVTAMGLAREQSPNDFPSWFSKNTTFNYSWGGGYMVQKAAGGVPIALRPFERVDGKQISRSHHEEFKAYFREHAGFDLPTPKELVTVCRTMTAWISWYEAACEMIERKADALQTQPSDSDGQVVAEEVWERIPALRELRQAEAILKSVQEAASNTDYFIEPPDVIAGAMSKERWFYHNLVYNNDDWVDLNVVAAFVGEELSASGLLMVPPDEGRIDRVFALVGRLRGNAAMENFDRRNLEQIEKNFTEKLYSKE